VNWFAPLWLLFVCAGAGAFLGRRAREGEGALNNQTVGQLLAGFFQFYAPVLGDWAQGRNSSWRASTWWGNWKEAGWPGAKNYIFCIEDPFNAGKRMYLIFVVGGGKGGGGEGGRGRCRGPTALLHRNLVGPLH
jgi:hypothetical protein